MDSIDLHSIESLIIPLPKRVEVLRLFRKKEIEDLFDLLGVYIDSPDFIDFKKESPSKPDLFYIKNRAETLVQKALYIGELNYAPKDCHWYHPKINSYIANSEIGWWMPLPEPAKQ